MPVIDYEQLRQAVKPNHIPKTISQNACDFTDQLIQEYRIPNDDELAERLNISDCKSHKALRLWVQQQLPLIDADETNFEQYRQIRRLFYAKFSSLVEEVY